MIENTIAGDTAAARFREVPHRKLIEASLANSPSAPEVPHKDEKVMQPNFVEQMRCASDPLRLFRVAA